MAENKSTGSEKFLKGTMILTIASFVVKVIGSLNWIFVSRILGGEGIGLYQMAFPIYFFAMTVSQAGVPVAISIITAERVALNDIFGAKRVFRISMALMFVTGLIFSVLTYFSASWLIEYQFIRDSRAYMSVVVLAPTVFFVTFLAASRGYLQGWQRMTPTAVSQIVEQIFRVIVMIVLADLLLPWGLDYAAAGASLGALAGAVTGLMVLVYFHIKLNKEIEETYGATLQPTEQSAKESTISILKRMFKLALPVSASSIMLPIISNLDLMIVPQRLEVAGYSVPQATELFGYLNGMAVPLINLATILTASLAVSIVPAISEARALKNTDRIFLLTASAFRISNFVCFPAFIVIFLLATPISTLIYNAPGAGDAVMISAVSIILLGLHQVSTGVLQGLGHTTIPMMNMILGAAANVFLSWYLTAMPMFGIMGAAWAMAADVGVAAFINLYFIHKYIGYRMEFGQLLKTICAAGVMAAVIKFFYEFTMTQWNIAVISTFGAVFVGCAVYIAAVALFGAMNKDDLQQIPMIGRIAVKVLSRIGIFKD